MYSQGHGVFATHSKLRAAVTPAHRGTGASRQPATAAGSARPPAPGHVAMSWARRLKRVFGIEIEDGAHCGGLPASRLIRAASSPACAQI
jgi:hypothetical protein